MQAAERSKDPADLFLRLEQLNDIGVARSRQTDISRLLETILVAAKNITNADGGTLYRVTEERTLQFEIMRNDTLGIAIGGTTGVPVPFPSIALFHDCGKVTTPVQVVDKATKLHALFDRIELIDTRFEVVRRDLELELCRARLDVRQNGDGESLAAIERKCAARLAEIDVDRAFLRRCNRMDPEPIDAIDTSKIPGYVDPPAQ